MPAPSPLAIATSSLARLVKERASYDTELAAQQASLARLERQVADGAAADEDADEAGNLDFRIRQERRAVDETRAVFPRMDERIANAKANLESLLDSHGGDEQGDDVVKARELYKSVKERGGQTTAAAAAPAAA